MIEMEVTLDDIADNFELRVARKGNFSRQHDVEDDSERPDVNLRVVVLQEHLWCDVVWLSTGERQVSYDSSTLFHLQSRSWFSLSLGQKSPLRDRSRSF